MTVVLITGALTGIGRATALAFAREGDQIVVSRRHGEAGEALAQELRAHGAEAEFICADVRHDNEMRNLVDQTVKRFGRLEVAVNNAGHRGPSRRNRRHHRVSCVQGALPNRTVVILQNVAKRSSAKSAQRSERKA